MNDFTKEQASKWVNDEAKKIVTRAQAKERVASIKRSAEGFWLTPGGIEAGKRTPNSRAAQLFLMDALSFAWKL